MKESSVEHVLLGEQYEVHGVKKAAVCIILKENIKEFTN